MVGIDISKLGMDELRRLSRLAQSRGQASLAEAIATELRTRPLRSADPQPLAPAPAFAAPVLPPRPMRRAPRSGWPFAAVAGLALILASGFVVPAEWVKDARALIPQALALTEAPVADALCTARSVLGDVGDCTRPRPVAKVATAT